MPYKIVIRSRFAQCIIKKPCYSFGIRKKWLLILRKKWKCQWRKTIKIITKCNFGKMFGPINQYRSIFEKLRLERDAFTWWITKLLWRHSLLFTYYIFFFFEVFVFNLRWQKFFVSHLVWNIRTVFYVINIFVFNISVYLFFVNEFIFI